MPSPPEKRSCLTSGEWLTLAGMVLVVMGAAFAWVNEPPKIPPGVAGEIYRAKIIRGNFTRTAYDLDAGPLKLGWLLVLCSVVCGSLLLVAPGRGERRAFMALQLALSLVILAISVYRFSLQPGVICALVGGLLLLAGGIRRYGAEAKAARA